MRSLRQLEIFLQVARLQSIRRAAEELGISQPAVSSALADLQREIGALLIERQGRGISLTAPGRILENYARRSIALLEEAREAVRAASSATAKIRIAAVTGAAESFMPGLLRGFSGHQSGLQVELEVANRERVWDRLAHWEVELVIAGRAPTVPRFRSLALRKNELVVVAPGESQLEVSELGTATWLLREPGSGTRALTEELFTLLHIAPPQLTIGSNGAIRECVRAGLGISLMSLDAVAAPLAQGQFAIVPTPATPLLRTWQLVTNADRSMTSGAHRFVAYAIAAGAFAAPVPS